MEIKNEGPISKEQAAAFWDDIFDEKEPKKTFDIFDYLLKLQYVTEYKDDTSM